MLIDTRFGRSQYTAGSWERMTVLHIDDKSPVRVSASRIGEQTVTVDLRDDDNRDTVILFLGNGKAADLLKSLLAVLTPDKESDDE